MAGEQGTLLQLEPNQDGRIPSGSRGEPEPVKEELPPKPRFQPIDREQLSWRMVNVERLIEEDHPARAIWEFVGKLDLSAYTAKVLAVEGMAGRPSLDPRLLISLWIYAYSNGVGSARAIERLCGHDPAYQWLTGVNVVNAHSLSDFRVEYEEALKGLFVQVLALLSADGLITLHRVMQDGTKIRASAASDSFRTEKGIQGAIRAAQEHVEAVDQTSEEESTRRAIKARERAQKERSQRLQSALGELQKLQQEGKDKQKVRASTTDPEARVMMQADGGFAPSYNVQVNTDSAHGLVVAVDVTQAGNDVQQLTSGVENVEQNLGDKPKQMVADGGYVSRDNIIEMKSRGVDFIGPQCNDQGKGKHLYQGRGISAEYHNSKFVYEAESDRYVCPRGRILVYDSKEERKSIVIFRYRAEKADCQACPAKGQCCAKNRVSGRSIHRTVESPEVGEFRQKMKTEEARNIYRQRSQVAETPNLWIKAKFKLRQFSVRGLRKVGQEAVWVCLTYNICQWIRLGWRMKIAIAAAVV
jgi:transposase